MRKWSFYILLLFVNMIAISCKELECKHVLTSGVDKYKISVCEDSLSIATITNGKVSNTLVLLYKNGEYYDKENSKLFLSTKRDTVFSERMNKLMTFKTAIYKDKERYYTTIWVQDGENEIRKMTYIYNEDYVLSEIVNSSPMFYKERQ